MLNKLKQLGEKLLDIEDIKGVKTKDLLNMVYRVPLSKYLLPVSYNETDKIYFTDDNYACFVLDIYPKPSIGEQTLIMLENGLYKDNELPENTLIQWNYWSSNYIEPILNNYTRLKNDKYKSIAKEYCQYLLDHTNKDITDDWSSVIKDVKLFFTCKIPCSIKEYDKKRSSILAIKNNIYTVFEQSGSYPHFLPVENLVFIYRMLFNPGHPSNDPIIYDPDIEIREQIIDRDTAVYQDTHSNILSIDKNYGKVLSAKVFPSQITSIDVNEYIGSIHHINRNQINTPFIFSFLLRKQNSKEIVGLRSKAEMIMKQKSFSSLSSNIERRQADISALIQQIEDGQVLWKGNLFWYFYDKSLEKLDKTTHIVKNMLFGKGIELQEEIVPLPFMLASTPLNFPDTITYNNLKRFKTMFSYNAANLTPIQSDWKGSGTPTIPLISRRGQLMFFDLWDTQGGMNACIVGPMGQGKSVFTNHLIFNYRSQPNVKVRVIDVGRSYFGITKLFNGNFVEPSFSNPININPFSNVNDIDQDMSFLVDIVDQMIKPTERCSDTERGVIEMSIRNALKRYGNDTTITFIRDEMNIIAEREKAKDFQRLAMFNLLPWCRNGQYAKFFEGRSAIDLSNKLITVELGQIKDDKKLTNVLLTTIFYHFNQEIYQGDKTIKKIIVWDEAWRFIKNEQVLSFIEMGSREYRKFNSSLVFITQHLSDLNANSVVRVLKANSDFLLTFWQQPEEWDKAQSDKLITLSEYEKDTLKNTLRTAKGQYSEIFITSASHGRGIGRLLLPPYFYWLYTTDAKEVAFRETMLEQYQDLDQAIKACVKARKGGQI